VFVVIGDFDDQDQMEFKIDENDAQSFFRYV
jgi:hypothetical protein